MDILKQINKYLIIEGKEKGDGPEYKAFFNKILKKYGVKDPSELKGDKKKEFFDEVDKGWVADKESD